MKIISLSLVLSSILLAGCGSGHSAGAASQTAAQTAGATAPQEAGNAAIAAQMAANAKKPVPTAEECQARSTNEERSDCMYDRMMRTPVTSRHTHTAAPVVDPLLGKPINDDSKPAPASSSPAH